VAFFFIPLGGLERLWEFFTFIFRGEDFLVSIGFISHSYGVTFSFLHQGFDVFGMIYDRITAEMYEYVVYDIYAGVSRLLRLG